MVVASGASAAAAVANAATASAVVAPCVRRPALAPRAVMSPGRTTTCRSSRTAASGKRPFYTAAAQGNCAAAVYPSVIQMPAYDTRHGRILLEREGQGRYDAFIVPSGQVARLRLGVVLGGGRLWQAELVGRRVPVRASTRPALAKAIAEWAVTQPGVANAATVVSPSAAH